MTESRNPDSAVTPAKSLDRTIADAAAFLFTVIILIYAASGPLGEFVRWFIETTSDGFSEMSRRDQRLLLKQHWLGAAFKSFERGFLLPTGLILGLPIIMSFFVTFMTLHKAPHYTWVNRTLAVVSTCTFMLWVANLFSVDAGVLPAARPVDFVFFPIASVLTLYLTWRLFGSFIVGFLPVLDCLFLRSWLDPRLDGDPGWLRIDVFAVHAVDGAELLVADGGHVRPAPSGCFRKRLDFHRVRRSADGVGSRGPPDEDRQPGCGRADRRRGHAAVASSALFGTLSGAAISNVVSTGVMTIPVIKRSGFKPAFAGAVEAAASTGGQIVPPVMGVVAFFVAGQIGLEYRYIVIAAIVPAVFYYIGTFLTVYFEARRQGIGPLPIGNRPALGKSELWQTLVFVIPLVTLSYFLFVQPSVLKAGFYGFVVAFVCALILFRQFRSWSTIYRACVDAGRMSASIIVIVTAIGLIVGLIQVSGFSGRLSLLLTQLAAGPLLTTLVVVALGSIVLGMGLPPGATYFIIVIALSSGIDAVGLAPLTLHMFVVFFAVISTVTPPVALAAFAAAPIAGANPMRTGLEAARLSLAGFIIPFVFVYHPAVLYKLQVLFEWFEGELPTSRAMIDASTVSWMELGWIVLAFSISMWLLASALAGFEKNRLRTSERLLRIIAGLAILLPDPKFSIPALALSVALVVGHRLIGGEPSKVDTRST